MHKSNSLDMNLQYFADPNNDPNQGQSGNNTDPNSSNPNTGDNNTNPNDKNPKNDSQAGLKYSDEDVQKIVQDTLAKADEQNKANIAAAVKEAQEKAKLNAQQLKDYNFKKLQEENEQLKAQSKHMELINKARSELNKSGLNLSSGELNLVVADDEETTLKNIDVIKAMQDRLTKSIKDDLTKGHTPPTDLNTDPKSLVSKISKRLGGR